MIDERLRAEQMIINELIDAYKGSGFIKYCSKEMEKQLGMKLAERIADGHSYIATMGEERFVPDDEQNFTRLCRTVFVQRLIRCMDCKHTPRISEDAQPYVKRLLCHKSGETVHPLGYCAWAEEREEVKE